MSASEDFCGDKPANAPSIHYAMSAREYHSDADGPRLSQSLATLACTKTVMHAWASHPLLGAHAWNYEPSEDDGTLIHSLILEPDSESILEVDASAIRTKEGKPAANPFATTEGKALRASALASGKIPILTEKLGAYRYKAKALRVRLADIGVTFDGDSEVVIYWLSNGVRCRARLDHLTVTPDGIDLTDLKTCDSAHPHDSQRTAWLKGYDIQRAAYVEAVEALFPDYVGRVRYRLALCELDKPYAANAIEFSPEFCRVGELRWARGRERWKAALERDEWTGYTGAVIDVPAWAKTQEMGE